MTRASWILVALFALASGGRAALAWHLERAQLIPDSALYAQGGIGLFPSPLGRLAGASGIEALAAVNVVAAAALVVLVALLALELGGRPVVAAAIATVTPLAWWTIFAAVDALGAALLVAAILADRRGAARAAAALAITAVLAHLSLVPVILLWAAVRRSNALRVRIGLLVGVGAFGALGALLTPYRGILGSLDHPVGFVTVAAATLGIALLPFVPWLLRLLAAPLRRELVAVALGTAAAIGLQRAATGDTNSRYALALTMVAAAAAAIPVRPGRLWLRT